MNTISIHEDGTTPQQPVSKFTSLDMGFREFNPLQSRFVLENLHQRNVNILCAWPTSAGKTVVAELIIEQSILRGLKAIYACPLKALAEEKATRFRRLFPGHRLEIFTGDYRDVKSRAQKAEAAEIAIVTTELLDSATRRAELFKALIARAGVVVIDEAHIIATDRGPAVESALAKLTEANNKTRLILLSATVGNPGEIAEWMSGLNGKTTVVLESSWRPVDIEWHLSEVANYISNQSIRRSIAIDTAARLIGEIITEDPEAQVLAFVWTKPEGYRLSKRVEQLGIKCLFHNASLELEERLNYEEKFDTKKIKVLISTTTLAWGKNTSARHVVIVGDKRGWETVPAWDVLQAGGRAGRTGLAPRGDVWWITYDEKYASSVLKKRPDIESLLMEPRKLAFALLGEFPYKERANLQKLRSWFRSTLAGKIYRNQDVVDAALVKALKLLRNEAQAITDNLTLTHVGRAAKLFYMDPCETKALETALAGMVNRIPDLADKVKTDHVPTVIILMARVVGMENFYVSKAEIEKMEGESPNLKRILLSYVGRGLIRTYSHYGAVMYVLRWLNEMRNYLFKREGKRPYPHYKVRDLVWDMDRVGSAVEFLAKEMELEKVGKALADNGLAIKYGAPLEAVDLLKERGIGAVRAVELLKAGIRTREELGAKGYRVIST